jgi:GNAT superfamily N-acetyltransferase
MKKIKLYEEYTNEAKLKYDLILKELGDGQLVVRAQIKTETIGELIFIKSKFKPVLKASSVVVQPAWQRQGIATEMYQFAEAQTGLKFVRNDQVLTGSGKALWNQTNRKFGL